MYIFFAYLWSNFQYIIETEEPLCLYLDGKLQLVIKLATS